MKISNFITILFIIIAYLSINLIVIYSNSEIPIILEKKVEMYCDDAHGDGSYLICTFEAI